MTYLMLKNFFEKAKAAKDIPYPEDLDEPHRFLYFALSCIGVGDFEIGHFEICDESNPIKYDGYYLDEDKKEFHVIGLVYAGDEQNGNNTSFLSKDCRKLLQGIRSFLNEALSLETDIGTQSQIGEHIQELGDDLDQGYSVFVDIYSDTNIPKKEKITCIEAGRGKQIKEISVFWFDGDALAEAVKDDEPVDMVVDFANGYNHKPLKATKISENDDFDVYLTSVSGATLAQVYKEHKNRLLDGNVRSFLKRTQKTNKGINATIKHEPKSFAAYNNGLSVLALGKGSDIRKIGDDFYLILSLAKMQVVNGGQTTVTIYEASRDPVDLSSVVVPMKITILKSANDDLNEDLATNIAKFTNTQTAIKQSDLASNKPFYKKLEQLSRDTVCHKNGNTFNDEGYHWFFERSSGSYNTRRRLIFNSSKAFDKQFPLKCKFAKNKLAKAIMACSRMPNIVCLGNEKCFCEYDRMIADNGVPATVEYYKEAVATVILWDSADKIIAKNKLPIKAAVLPYAIAYVFEKCDGRLDLMSIWDSQKIDDGLKRCIDGVSRMISQYFVSVSNKYPNTLMYGRKKECWEAVKRLYYGEINHLLHLADSQINFFPANPAIRYISDNSNFNNIELWKRMLAWNEGRYVLTDGDVEKIQSIISTIKICFRVLDKSLINNGKRIFKAAVDEGFDF